MNKKICFRSKVTNGCVLEYGVHTKEMASKLRVTQRSMMGTTIRDGKTNYWIRGKPRMLSVKKMGILLYIVQEQQMENESNYLKTICGKKEQKQPQTR